MSIQVLIGSTSQEVGNIVVLQNVVQWVRQMLVDTYGNDDYPQEIPFTYQELENVDDWISGLYNLLTDVNVFSNDDFVSHMIQ